MPNSGGVEAGRAFLKLYTDDSAFKRGIDAATRKIQGFASSLKSVGSQIGIVGAGIVAPFAGALKIFSDTGSELADMAARTSLSVKSLSELKYAALQTGAGLDAVEGGVRKMQKSLAAAASGNDAASTAFTSLGLSVAELLALSPDEQFNRVAMAVGAIEDPAKRTAAAMQVFGKSGTAMLPMIADMETLREKARRLGLVWNDEMVAAADKLGDTIDTLKMSFLAVASAIGAQVAPVVTEFGNKITSNTGAIIKWIGEHKKAILTIGALGAALTIIGPAAIAAAAAMDLFATAIKAAAFAALLFTRHPLVAVLTAIAGVLVYLVSRTQWFSQVMEGLNDKVAEMVGLESQLTAEIENGNAAMARRAELQNKIAANRARTGNPWGITADRKPPLDADADPLGFGQLDADKKLSEFTEHFRNAWRDIVSGANPLLGILKQHVDAAKGVGRFARDVRLQAIQGKLFPAGGFPINFSQRGTFEGRLASQIFGGGHDTAARDRKEQIRLTREVRDHLREIRKKTFLLRTGTN